MPEHLIVMGVSGCGKSTVGRALAVRLGRPFADGDDLHSTMNLAKMASGVPLTTQDREGWLGDVRDQMNLMGSSVVACSALHREYRDVLREASGAVRFVHLAADRALTRARMRSRKDHFMPASLALSQFSALEPLDSDEDGITLDASTSPDLLVELAADWDLSRRPT